MYRVLLLENSRQNRFYTVLAVIFTCVETLALGGCFY